MSDVHISRYVGRELGHYRLIFLIGHGGFADVYLGEHIHLKSLAAIKLLRSNLNDTHQENFINEACTLARLVHPHITRILDFGIEKGVAFLVMEFATHGTLRQRYPEHSKLPLALIIDYMNQIADALQCAHDQKFIHRDLKPENILIGQRDDLLLSDFGAALFGRSVNDPTLEERFMGTAPYTAPEQWDNKPQFASDQYAMGIMAYEWLCGRRPFRGKFIEIYRQHHNQAPPPLREIVPSLPIEVEQVVLRALEKDPARRYPNVSIFAAELELAYQLSRRKTAISRPSIPDPSVSAETSPHNEPDQEQADEASPEDQQTEAAYDEMDELPTVQTIWQTAMLRQMRDSTFYAEPGQDQEDEPEPIEAEPPSSPHESNGQDIEAASEQAARSVADDSDQQPSEEANITVQLHPVLTAYLNNPFAEMMENDPAESSPTDITVVLNRGAIKKNWSQNFSPRRSAK